MIDLQAYMDGSMPANERAEVELQLQTDGKLAAELAGLRELQAATRFAVLAEPVPYGRLEMRLGQTARKGARNWLRFAIPTLGVALAAVATFLLTRKESDPMRLDQSPVVASTAVSDVDQASVWASAGAGFNVPAMRLSEAKLTQASYGSGWARYQYLAAGQTVDLTMSKSYAPLGLGQLFTDADGHHMRRGLGFGWSYNGMGYYLTGADEATRLHLACAACKQCGGTDADCGASFALRYPDIFDLSRTPAELARHAPSRPYPRLLQVAYAESH